MAERERVPLVPERLAELLREKVLQRPREPEHTWGEGFRSFMREDGGGDR